MARMALPRTHDIRTTAQSHVRHQTIRCVDGETTQDHRCAAHMCAICASYVAHICHIYPPYIPHICPTYAPHMCRISPIFPNCIKNKSFSISSPFPKQLHIKTIYGPHMAFAQATYVQHMGFAQTTYVPHMGFAQATYVPPSRICSGHICAT